MKVAVTTETFPGENRVALVPSAVPPLIKLGLDVHIQSGAGRPAGFTDNQYQQKGATVVDSRSELLADADIVCQVRAFGANPDLGSDDLSLCKAGAVLIGHADPLLAHSQTQATADANLTLLAMELVPRITRAQSMDALSSQANLAGYKAVLMAADASGKIMPMMMTAAGTLKPAKAFIVGAGVAGLQAIATAKRLGAVVSAIDVRPETKEQVESLGAKFVEPPESASGEGGYAKEQTDEQKQKQQQLMTDTVAESDIVITTAAIPGRPSPRLITEDMVQRMQPGSVIVDLASERGGNVECTVPDQVVTKHGVTIIGTNNVPSLVATDCSVMYAGNIVKLLQELFDKEGNLQLDTDNEITAGILVCKDGQILQPMVRERMGLEPLAQPEPDPQPEPETTEPTEGSDT